MAQPSTEVSRMPEKQHRSRAGLDKLLDSTPLATIALIRDGHPVIFPTGCARIGDELIIHGSTGSPWLRQLAEGAPAAVSVTTLDGVLVARSGFESSFQFHSATLFGTFEPIRAEDKVRYLELLVETFIPGRVAEIRESTNKELAATLALRMKIEDSNWSLKIGDGWSEDPDEDIASPVWAGIVPLTTVYGEPLRSPDCEPSIPVPPSVLRMPGEQLRNRRDH